LELIQQIMQQTQQQAAAAAAAAATKNDKPVKSRSWSSSQVSTLFPFLSQKRDFWLSILSFYTF
jgi:hypothetical protein